MKIETEKSIKYLSVQHNLCNACGLCEIICSLHHEEYISKECSRIKIVKGDINILTFCLQCSEPLCQKNCPVEAITRCDYTGLLHVDHERCVRCKCCVISCPFGGSVEDCNGHIVRCDLCGGEPQCAQFCPTGALSVISEIQEATRNKRRRFAINSLQQLINRNKDLLSS